MCRSVSLFTPQEYNDVERGSVSFVYRTTVATSCSINVIIMTKKDGQIVVIVGTNAVGSQDEYHHMGTYRISSTVFTIDNDYDTYVCDNIDAVNRAFRSLDESLRNELSSFIILILIIIALLVWIFMFNQSTKFQI